MYPISQAELVVIQEAAKRCPWEYANTIMAVLQGVAQRPTVEPPKPPDPAAPTE